MNRFSVVILSLIASLTTAAFAQDGVQSVRLFPGWQEDDGRYVGALQIVLEPGWKTYWRAPGEGGIPASFDFLGSTNIIDAEPVWPTPEVFWTYGMRSIGYEKQLVLPFFFEVVPAAQFADIQLDLAFGVCADICIPAEARTSARLPLQETHNEGPIRAALSKGPLALADSGVSSVFCDIVFAEDGAMMLSAEMRTTRPPSSETIVVFELPSPDVWIGQAAVETSADRVLATARLDYFGDGVFAMERSALRLSLITPDRVFEQRGC